MKSLLKGSLIILFFFLSFKSFGQVIIRADEEIRFQTAGDRFRSNPGTPVYSKLKTDTVGILEIDNPGVAARFAAVFPLAANQVWIKEAGSLYVSFIWEGKKVSAVFNLKGSMSYSIASIKLGDIPAGIAEKIKTGYNGYSMVNAKEITVDADTIYHVLLETRFEYVVVSCSNDEIEEREKVKKIF